MTLALDSAEGGGGLCDNYFSHENSPIYRVTILHVTRYQLMSWMVASGRLILPDGLSRCDRDWSAVTRYARHATPLHLRGQRRRCGTRCLQRVASSVATDGDALRGARNALRL